MKEGIDTWGQGKSLSYHLLLFQVRSTFWIYQSDTSVLRLVSPTSFYLFLALSGRSIDTHTHTLIYICVCVSPLKISPGKFSWVNVIAESIEILSLKIFVVEWKCYPLQKDEKCISFLCSKTQRKEIIWRLWHWWEDNIKVHHRE